MQHPPEPGKGKETDLPSGPPERNAALPLPSFESRESHVRLLNNRTVSKQVCFVLSPSVGGDLLQQ